MITVNELAAIKPIGRKKLSLYTGILRKHWCPFAVSMGKCNRMCAENPYCQESLVEILNGVHPSARSEQAVLIWRIRNQKARLREVLETPSLERNRWGEPVSGMGLKLLAKELGLAPVRSE